MSKVQMIVVDSGELYVFGKLISRHPDFPWLFSITDVYKACELPLKREAKKYGKDPEVTYVGKKPANWLNKNSSVATISAVAKEVRSRAKLHGTSSGFDSQLNDSWASLRKLSDLQVCIFRVKGGNARSKVHGTYVCQDLVVGYAGSLNATLKARIHSTFISVLNGYTEEVTKKVEKNERIAKGTQARTDNKELNSKLVEACGRKGVLPMKVQEGINEGVLGLNATKYKKAFGIKEPFNDNILEVQVATKNVGIIMATTIISTHKKPKLSNVEGKQIGKSSGLRAKLIFNNPEVHKLLDKLEKKIEALA